ncbi:MAG TPA: metal ABC transporter permease [Gemmatimonadaceae bacterium]
MLETLLLFTDALIGALVIAVACAVLGVYVVLRRIVFVGAALAQMSSAGIALAYWLAGQGMALSLTEHPEGVSLAVTLGSVAFFARSSRGPVPPDARIGVWYAVAAAAGILLIAKATVGEAHDIFLQGNILGITRKDTIELVVAAIPVLTGQILFYKEFLFISFDRETARTLGYRVWLWDLGLYLTLGFVISIAMQFAGVMLVFNFLVLPAVTGLLLAHGMAGVFLWSIAAAVLAALIGYGLSIPLDLPTGPAMIAVSGILVLVALVVRRMQRRG